MTDRCNFRCMYCMPEGPIDDTEKENILTFEEINRLVGILSRNGVRKIRLTGGEPTIRRHFVELCRMITSDSDVELAITTNGVLLKRMAKDLWEAGVTRLNISLDTFDEDKFNTITRRKNFKEVIEGIDEALKYRFEIKINAVSIKTLNDDLESLESFIAFSNRTGTQIRFIELMPFTGNQWTERRFLSSKELREKIEKISKLKEEPRGITQTSRNYSTGGAKFGFISSVTETFCSNCDRIRITADGNLRPCLHANKEYPLRELMRNGITDEELLEKIKIGLAQKWEQHPDFLALHYMPPIDDREMIRLGG